MIIDNINKLKNMLDYLIKNEDCEDLLIFDVSKDSLIGTGELKGLFINEENPTKLEHPTINEWYSLNKRVEVSYNDLYITNWVLMYKGISYKFKLFYIESLNCYQPVRISSDFELFICYKLGSV